MKSKKNIFELIPRRLIATTILMALILILIVVFILNLIAEKSRIQEALDLSQKNREQISLTENVTESLVIVEARFKEYCTTFDKTVFNEYQQQVKVLAENIALMQRTYNQSPSLASKKIDNIIDEKNKEADVYMKLRQMTDSLIFSVANLHENQLALGNMAGNYTDLKIDTVSVTEAKEIHKKGLFGKLKSALVGEKVKQNVTTKLRVQTKDIRNTLAKQHEANKANGTAARFNVLAQKTVELKASELNLIEINNDLIAQIQGLVESIKINIKEQEAKYNDVFLKSVKHSTYLLQNILIALMVLAFLLAIYILKLAYRNDKFQNNIISLNEKIMKDSIEKDKFYSIVSHDIMNPFNALLGFSKILKDAVKEGDQIEIEECSEIVHQSANRISNLLHNLLVWSRMQNGKIQFSAKKQNINQLITDAVSVVSPIAKNKNISIDLFAEEGIEAEVDNNMIGSVMQNLITNAIKFTERGGEVKITANTESSNLNVVVADSGIGMSEEQLHKLFKLDKTSSAKGTDDETGTGLGLIISKEFIEKHNGRIWAESTLGKGSKFCFSIPMA